ncbi:MAG: ester cyclase [Bacteroidota bacterium]
MEKQDLIHQANQQLIHEGDLDAIPRFFTEEYQAHAEGKTHQGHAFLLRFTKQIRAALPDIRVVKVEIHCTTPDQITFHRTLQGTHQKALRGIPPSQKKVTWHEMVVSRFEGDKIAEEWLVSNLAGQLMLKLPKA